MGSEASMIWNLIFGSIGLGYFIYGKKQKKGVPLACGIGLMIFPYVVSNTVWLVVIGSLLSAVPYFLRF